MDVRKMIKELRAEHAEIERAINALQKVGGKRRANRRSGLLMRLRVSEGRNRKTNLPRMVRKPDLLVFAPAFPRAGVMLAIMS